MEYGHSYGYVVKVSVAHFSICRFHYLSVAAGAVAAASAGPAVPASIAHPQAAGQPSAAAV